MHMIQVIQINKTKNKGRKKRRKTKKETEQNSSLFRLTLKKTNLRFRPPIFGPKQLNSMQLGLAIKANPLSQPLYIDPKDSL